MFNPPHFQETDHDAMAALIDAFPLATLVCQYEGELIVNHIPFLMRGEDQLIGHIAKANPLHTYDAEGLDAVAIFRAEDAYISPNLYPTKQQTHRHVPTWNYQVVHLHGRVQFDHSDKAKRAAVGQLTKQQERRHNGDQEWKMSDAPQDYMTAMLDNIVALSFSIARYEAKNKISQNRESVDFDAVQEAMTASEKTYLAKAMTKVQKK